MLDEFALRDNAIAIISEIAQQSELSGENSIARPLIITAQAPRIDANGPDLDQRRDVAADTAQQGGEAGEKLLHLEGLRQVVVGARIDALDPLQPRAAGGQNEDRHRARPPPAGAAPRTGRRASAGRDRARWRRNPR